MRRKMRCLHAAEALVQVLDADHGIDGIRIGTVAAGPRDSGPGRKRVQCWATTSNMLLRISNSW